MMATLNEQGMAKQSRVSAHSEDPLQDFFIRQNIDRYRKLLETALDDNEPKKIAKLLAREEVRLSRFLDLSGQEAHYRSA